jgi:hypothetical protein
MGIQTSLAAYKASTLYVLTARPDGYAGKRAATMTNVNYTMIVPNGPKFCQ